MLSEVNGYFLVMHVLRLGKDLLIIRELVFQN